MEDVLCNNQSGLLASVEVNHQVFPTFLPFGTGIDKDSRSRHRPILEFRPASWTRSKELLLQKNQPWHDALTTATSNGKNWSISLCNIIQSVSFSLWNRKLSKPERCRFRPLTFFSFVENAKDRGNTGPAGGDQKGTSRWCEKWWKTIKVTFRRKKTKSRESLVKNENLWFEVIARDWCNDEGVGACILMLILIGC